MARGSANFIPGGEVLLQNMPGISSQQEFSSQTEDVRSPHTSDSILFENEVFEAALEQTDEGNQERREISYEQAACAIAGYFPEKCIKQIYKWFIPDLLVSMDVDVTHRVNQGQFEETMRRVREAVKACNETEEDPVPNSACTEPHHELLASAMGPNLAPAGNPMLTFDGVFEAALQESDMENLEHREMSHGRAVDVITNFFPEMWLMQLNKSFIPDVVRRVDVEKTCRVDETQFNEVMGRVQNAVQGVFTVLRHRDLADCSAPESGSQSDSDGRSPSSSSNARLPFDEMFEAALLETDTENQERREISHGHAVCAIKDFFRNKYIDRLHPTFIPDKVVGTDVEKTYRVNQEQFEDVLGCVRDTIQASNDLERRLAFEEVVRASEENVVDVSKACDLIEELDEPDVVDVEECMAELEAIATDGKLDLHQFLTVAGRLLD